MSKESTLKGSQTDWEALDKMEDKDIDLSETPEVTAEQMSRAKMRAGGKPVTRGKVRINMYLDAEIVEQPRYQFVDVFVVSPAAVVNSSKVQVFQSGIIDFSAFWHQYFVVDTLDTLRDLAFNQDQ